MTPSPLILKPFATHLKELEKLFKAFVDECRKNCIKQKDEQTAFLQFSEDHPKNRTKEGKIFTSSLALQKAVALAHSLTRCADWPSFKNAIAQRVEVFMLQRMEGATNFFYAMQCGRAAVMDGCDGGLIDGAPV
jgi:hypothetical protein